MGPQTSQGGRRRGIAGLAALGVAGALLGGSALISASLPSSATPRASAPISFLREANFVQFDGRPGAPNNQIAGVTLVNTGKTAITVNAVTPTIRGGGVVPWPIVAGGEDCTGAVIQPLGYCVVSLEFNPVPGQVILNGDVFVNASDGTNTAAVGSSDQSPFALTADPVRVNFGSVTVGTSAQQQVTVHAAESGQVLEPIESATVDYPARPGIAPDYQRADGCAFKQILAPIQGSPFPSTCQIGLTAAPQATGSRPALLDVTYCNPNVFDVGTPPGGGSQAPLPPPAGPPGQEVICGHPDGNAFADHLLVPLTATGLPGTTPPVVPPGNATYNPVLTPIPAVAPGGRTTMVSGTGFPINTSLTFALVPVSAPATTALTAVPGSVTLMTNGIGGFTQVMLIMPHTNPGQYEIRAITTAPPSNAKVAFLVAPGTQEPPKFVTRH